MAQTQTDLYNMALGSIGSKHFVSAPTENSVAVEICNVWYAPVRRQVLRAAFWTSAKAFERSALDVERDPAVAWVSTDPAPGYVYSYLMPSDMLQPRYLSTYARFSTGIKPDGTRVYYTNQEDPILAYTKDQTDPTTWSADLYMAVALALGASIALQIQGKPIRQRLAEERANDIILAARVHNANEEYEHWDVLPEWLEARGTTIAPSRDKYFHPYGSLISTASGISVE